MATALKEKQAPTEQETEQEEAPFQARPFLKWAGGKTTLLPRILERVPTEFDRYFEPFVGGGAVFFRLASLGKISKATLSDTNEDLVNAYSVVRSKCAELRKDLARHQYESEYFYKTRNADREANYKYWSDVQRASRLIFLNKTCFNGLYRLNSKGQFNTPFGRYKNPTILDEENLLACSEALQMARVRKLEFDEVLKHATSKDFVYFDPPYIPLNKTSQFTSYTKGGFGEEMHRKLADVCAELSKRKVKFLLSNSDTELSRELYKDFTVDTVYAPRAINSKAGSRGTVSELLVRNY